MGNLLEKKFVGVDFGAKLRPTTAITERRGKKLVTELCPKKRDVDAWLAKSFLEKGITHVFIDAPLSLPKIYFDPTDEKSTHHFRLADREVGAMSPMFLGGLTARAIALKALLEKNGITFYETYPSALLQKRFPGKDREEALLLIVEQTGCTIPDGNKLNAHQKDSILAWYAGFLFFQENSLVFGRKEEGCIFV